MSTTPEARKRHRAARLRLRKGLRKGPVRRLGNLELKGPARQLLFVALGIASATLGLKSFILPNHFIDGGAMGISLLFAQSLNLPLGPLVFAINVPFVLMGWRLVSRTFALKTLAAIAVLSVAVEVAPFPDVTHEKILVAVFGGAFLGLGIGLAVRGGAVIDGTEVLALFLARRLSATLGDFILVINLVIFGVGAVVLGLEPAMYSVLTYLAASRAADFVIEGIEEYVGVHIISRESEAIRRTLTEELGRGVTIFRGRRGYLPTGATGQDVDILFCVITRLEIGKTKAAIHAQDPRAFIYTVSIKETLGGVVVKRPLH